MFRKITSGIGVLILLCCLSPRGVAEGAAQPSTIKGVVDAVAIPLKRKDRIPGMAIAVTLDGKNYFFNYGIESKKTRKPVTDDTLFEIGSLSKTFVATLASYSEVQGHVSLSDSVSKWLPLLRGSSFDRITLLNLATHTSGLPLFVPRNITDARELMNYLKKWQPPFPAGSHRIYSNIGVGLLGVITARSLRVSYEKALQRELFSQLGMKHSYIRVPPHRMGNYAQGYTGKNVPVRMHAGVLAAEAYGVKSCTADLIRFLEENMGLIKIDARMQSAILNTHAGYFRSAGFVQGLVWEEYRYPVGMKRLLAGTAAVFGQSVATRLVPPLPPQGDILINKTGATGGFSAYIAFVPAKRIGIVILANKAYPMKEEVAAGYGMLSRILSFAK